ncbi:MAG TPA: metal ABC transporter permease [Myxococcota bacterium]|nr:metal ABC transporter permease [Myxococcota bacterium]
MVEAFSHMIWPLLACFVLVGIHAYLGIHVIARKVIFVDLALAQIAALGAVFAVFIGISLEANPWWIKGISVTFTLFGAFLFAFTRTGDEKLPHEAIIGIIYAAALSMTLLLTANLPHGADEVSQMLSGNILWVRPGEVIYTAILYSVVGLFFLTFRRQFAWLSNDIALKGDKTLRVKLWDFLFYAVFGIVVTSSVSIGGVLLVFGYLVIPSVIGISLANSGTWRLLLGLSSGILMSIFGVVLSYHWDLPSGPTIVVMLSLLLLFVTLILKIAYKKSRVEGLFYAGVFLCVTISLLVLASFARAYQKTTAYEQEDKAALASDDAERVIRALNAIRAHWVVGLFDDVVPLISAENDQVRALAIDVLESLDEKRAVPVIKARLSQEKDIFIRLEIAGILAKSGDVGGLAILAAIMKDETSPLAREDALSQLNDLIIDSPRDAAKLSVWLNKYKQQLSFDPNKKKYYIKNSE